MSLLTQFCLHESVEKVNQKLHADTSEAKVKSLQNMQETSLHKEYFIDGRLSIRSISNFSFHTRLAAGKVHQVNLSRAGRFIELVLWVVDQPAALELLFHDTGIPRNGNLVAFWQSQVGQAAEGVLTIGPVEFEHAKLHDITRLLALPFAIGRCAEVGRNDVIGEIDHNISFRRWRPRWNHSD